MDLRYSNEAAEWFKTCACLWYLGMRTGLLGIVYLFMMYKKGLCIKNEYGLTEVWDTNLTYNNYS